MARRPEMPRSTGQSVAESSSRARKAACHSASGWNSTSSSILARVLGLDGRIVEAEVERIGEGLGDVEGAVDEALQAVAFRIVEVERPRIAVVDRDDTVDPGGVEAGPDRPEVVETGGAECHVIGHHELVLGLRHAGHEDQLVVLGGILRDERHLAVGTDRAPVGARRSRAPRSRSRAWRRGRGPQRSHGSVRAGVNWASGGPLVWARVVVVVVVAGQQTR